MAILTFDELHAEVAAFHAAEAARNEPAAIACRALETLRETLTEIMPGAERNEILREMRAVLCDAMLYPPIAATA